MERCSRGVGQRGSASDAEAAAAEKAAEQAAEHAGAPRRRATGMGARLGLQMTAAADAAPPYGGFGGGGAGAADSAAEATNEQCVGVWRCRLLWPRRATGPSNWRRRVRSLTYRHTKAARGRDYPCINLNAFRGQGGGGRADATRLPLPSVPR